VSRLRKHLTFSNVIACAALFTALSASAYAATKLGPGQVKSVNIANQAVINSKLKREAVTSGKIKKGGVTRANMGAGAVTTGALDTGAVTGKKIGKKAVSPRTLANEAVTAEKLANESVVASKLSASLYAQLVRNVAYISASSASNSEANKAVTASCPSGKQAIAGGVRLEGELAEVAVTGSYPLSSGNLRTGWEALAHETGPGQPSNWSVVAFAVCAEL
jgi:trimeric autotransporter adhesin